MIKRTAYFCLIAISLLLTATLDSCKKSTKSFKVNIELTGLKNQRVRVVFTNENNGTVDTWVQCQNDKFSVEGSCSDPTLFIVYNSANVPIMKLLINNGDEINVTGKVLENYDLKVKGSKLAEEYNSFIVKHKTEYKSSNNLTLNTAIEKYVKDNPKSLVSTVLVLFDYSPNDVSQVDKLLKSIDASARPESLMETYNMLKSRDKKPVTSLRRLKMIEQRSGDIVTTNLIGHKPSIVIFWDRDLALNLRNQMVDEVMMVDTAKVQIIDVSLDVDSTGWAYATRQDAALWKHYWAPGSIMNSDIMQLRVTSIPTIIVTDSLGNQQYRGDDIVKARQTIENILN